MLIIFYNHINKVKSTLLLCYSAEKYRVIRAIVIWSLWSARTNRKYFISEYDQYIYGIQIQLLYNLSREDDNDIKVFTQLTTIVPHDWNYNCFTIYLCEVVIKDRNILFAYLNIEKDDPVEDIWGINIIYKESTPK